MEAEEAINRIKNHMEIHGIGKYPHLKLAEALNLAILALQKESFQFNQKEAVALMMSEDKTTI